MATKSTVFFIVLCAYVRYVLAYTGQEEIADVALRLKKAGYISLKQMIKALIQNMVDSRQFIEKLKFEIDTLKNEKIDLENKVKMYKDSGKKLILQRDELEMELKQIRRNKEEVAVAE